VGPRFQVAFDMLRQLDSGVVQPPPLATLCDTSEALAFWDSPDTETEQRFARLRANDAYPRAARAFAAAMLSQAEADAALDGILKDAGRNIAAKALAYLHATNGVTLPNLKALCQRIGMVSPGRARALLLYLQYLGFVERLPRRSADQPRRYQPTPSFTLAWRRQMRAMLECAALIDPSANDVAAGLDDPTVYDAFVRSISEGYLEALSFVDDSSPYFRAFMHPYAGTQLVHSLVLLDPDHFPPRRSLAFSMNAAAARFGVSRMHVARMVELARRDGLVTLPERGQLRFEAAGRSAMDDIYATQLLVFLGAAARTLRVLTRTGVLEGTGRALDLSTEA
jgi:hypothetical protein